MLAKLISPGDIYSALLPAAYCNNGSSPVPSGGCRGGGLPYGPCYSGGVPADGFFCRFGGTRIDI